jgi:hypothetical protein
MSRHCYAQLLANILHNELLEHPVAMKKSLFVLLAFAILSYGCSTASLFYRNADWYLQHKIQSYTSFNAQQKETIHKEVADYMHWHRKNALPEYILFLQNLNGAAQYDGQLKVEEITLLRAHLLDLYRRTLMPAVQPTTQLLSSLDSEQILELGKTFAEDIKKQKEEVLVGTNDENLHKRAEKILDFLTWLAGSLSDEQEQKVREMNRRLPFANHIYIQNREANQDKLIALLNGHAGAERISAFLSMWILTPEMTRTPQQQSFIQSFETATDEMIAQIHSLLTDRQKDHMHKVISSYIKDMQILTAEMHATR